jgi:hypothetical protein
MGLLSSVGSFLSKAGDILSKPVELLTDWGREPLKSREHSRSMERETNSLNANAKIERENLKLKSKLKIDEEESQANLAIRKETEVHRIISEIDKLQTDKDFQRMKLVSEAIMRYQKELTKLNVNAINAIGNMQLELRDKAQDLVYSKTILYKELQDRAIEEAGDDLEKILIKFPDNERMQDIMVSAVEKRLANIIDTAHNFLIELNDDIKLLNKSINSLAEGGQKFIEKHLDNFHQLPGKSNPKMIKDNDEKDVIDI